MRRRHSTPTVATRPSWPGRRGTPARPSLPARAPRRVPASTSEVTFRPSRRRFPRDRDAASARSISETARAYPRNCAKMASAADTGNRRSLCAALRTTRIGDRWELRFRLPVSAQLPDCLSLQEVGGMELGFDTVGNATLILHDKVPLLATDPWITGSAYFGSWGLAHEIRAEQLDAVRRCKYLWISHGHPDHLSGDSLAALRDKIILVPDHRGARMSDDLKAQGFNVQVMPDRTWFELTPRVRVLCVPDYNQDAILLADVNGHLVINLNDAGPRGWGGFLKKVVRQYRRSILLSLVGGGDDCSEQLEPQEQAQLRAYFQRFERLRRNGDFLRFIVGGAETLVELRSRELRRGLTFEAPRSSLMTSVKYEIFDDLLIGNFM